MSRINIAEAGGDPTGQTPIDDILDKHNSENTEFYFPEGKYKLKNFATDHPNIQFRGDNATLIPTKRTSMANWFELHSDGFVMDGFEWDIRNCPYPPRFHLWGDNWRVANIAVRGQCGTIGPNGEPIDMNIHGVSYLRGWVTSEDGVGTFKNIYLNDGSGPPGGISNRRGFLIEGAEMRGKIVFDEVHMEQWGENTIYANNHPGEMVIKNCFFKNTNVGVRVGGNTTIKDTTFIRNYDVPLQRQGWSGGALMRGIRIEADDEWAYPGELLIKNCDFKFHSPSGNFEGGEGAWDSRPPIAWKAACEDVTIENCRIRYDGYHGSPIDKNDAIGAGGEQKTLTISNAQIDHRGYKDYCAVNIDRDPETIKEISGTAKSNGGLISGTTFKPTIEEGDPEEATEDSPMASVPPLGQTPGSSPDGHLLVIDATGSGRVDYTFEVDSDLRMVDEYGASMDIEDTVTGNRVDGWANNYLDAYRFSGEIREMTVTGNPTLLFAREGEMEATETTVDKLLAFTEEPLMPPKPENAHLLIIDGSISDESAHYEFEVSGEVTPAPEWGSFNLPDEVTGQIVSGAVIRQQDAYWYTGDIERIDITGDVLLKHAAPGEDTPQETTVEELTTTGEDVSDDEAMTFVKMLIAFLKRYFG